MKKETAYKYIDIAAGEARARYISTGPGQEMTYHLKSTQAKEYRDAGYTGDVPVFIQAEMAVTGMTAQQVADYIIATENQWLTLAVAVEQIRRAAKVQIEAETDLNVISQIQQNAINQLNLI